MCELAFVSEGRSSEPAVSNEEVSEDLRAVPMVAWGLLLGVLAMLPGVVALGVGVTGVDALLVFVITLGGLLAAAFMVGVPRVREG